MDGSKFNSARLPSRNIIINLRYLWAPTIEASRLKSYKFFPIKRPIKLLIETDERLLEIQGYVESNEPSIFSKQSGASISIICPDPYFYDAKNGGVTTIVFSSIVSSFESVLDVGFSNESLDEPLLEFSTILSDTQKLIDYKGDAPIGVNINIAAAGNANNVSVLNETTGERIDFDTDKLAIYTGSALIDGDVISICTIKGQKSAILHRGVETINVLNCLPKNPDWLNLVSGDNIYTYIADSGVDKLSFELKHRTRFEGA